jgi:hypothetical protein
MSQLGQTLDPRSEPECLRPPGADMTLHRRWAAMRQSRPNAAAAKARLYFVTA